MSITTLSRGPIDHSGTARSAARPRRRVSIGQLLEAIACVAGLTLAAPADAATFTWLGGGTTGEWTEGANWGTIIFPPFDNPPTSTRNGNDLVFDRANQLSSTNNVGAPTVTYGSIQFVGNQGGGSVGAGAFTISGTTLGISGTLANSSTNTQTFRVSSLNLPGSAATTVSVTGAPVVLDTIVTGGGGLTKTGTGQLSILRSPTLTGTTTVTAGTLVTGTGVTTVAGPVAITTTGTALVLGPTDFAAVSMSGGALMPGGTSSTSYLAMSVDSLALSGSARVVMGVGQKPTSDQIIVTGTGSGSMAFGGNLQLDLTGLGTTSYYQFQAEYPLFQFTAGASSGTLASLTSINGSGPYAGLSWNRLAADGTWYSSAFTSGVQPGSYFTFSERTGTLAVVPEPSTFAMAALGLAGTVLARYRRKGRKIAAALVAVAVVCLVAAATPQDAFGPVHPRAAGMKVV